jgi:hypothetical protein
MRQKGAPGPGKVDDEPGPEREKPATGVIQSRQSDNRVTLKKIYNRSFPKHIGSYIPIIGKTKLRPGGWEPSRATWTKWTHYRDRMTVFENLKKILSQTTNPEPESKTESHPDRLTNDDISKILQDFIEIVIQESREGRMIIFTTEDVAKSYKSGPGGAVGAKINSDPEKLNIPPPLDPLDLQKNFPLINAACQEFISFLGTKSTTLLHDPREPYMAAAAGLAGLMIFRRRFSGLGSRDERKVIIYPIDSDIQNGKTFINGINGSMGLDLSSGVISMSGSKNSILGLPALTCRFEQDYLSICKKHTLEPVYYPFVGLMTALRFIAAGKKQGILDERTGISMIIFYFIAGARMMPFSSGDSK